jgi:hypothetical protein
MKAAGAGQECQQKGFTAVLPFELSNKSRIEIMQSTTSSRISTLSPALTLNSSHRAAWTFLKKLENKRTEKKELSSITIAIY